MTKLFQCWCPSNKLPTPHTYGVSADCQGWKHTSTTPDCSWLWEKQWKDKTIMVTRNRALTMQQHGIWD
jgi:hypothetical protein